MSAPIARFSFHNDQDVDVEVVIEPWALSYVIAGGESVYFEVNAAPPPDIEFAITESGRAYIYVMSERVLIEANGKREVFNTKDRPPIQGFRAMKNILWPS